MKQLTRCILLFLMLGAPFSIHAGCKEPKQGPPGPQGPSGPPFVATYAAWYIPGDDGVTVNPGDILPFSVNETSNGITNASGEFTFSRNGVYQVTFGIAPQEANDVFDIELNGTLVSGGRVAAAGFSPQILTVIFSASAGDHLVVRNNGTNTVSIGIAGSGAPGTYIAILQIH